MKWTWTCRSDLDGFRPLDAPVRESDPSDANCINLLSCRLCVCVSVRVRVWAHSRVINPNCLPASTPYITHLAVHFLPVCGRARPLGPSLLMSVAFRGASLVKTISRRLTGSRRYMCAAKQTINMRSAPYSQVNPPA